MKRNDLVRIFVNTLIWLFVMNLGVTGIVLHGARANSDRLKASGQAVEKQPSVSPNHPLIIDFGGASAGAPIAGLQQWAAQSMDTNKVATTIPMADIVGTKNVMVLRVYFNSYPATARYTQAQVQGFFDNQLNSLWQNTSYGKISMVAQVSPLYQLPGNRSAYVGGDAEWWRAFTDAIANAPNGLNWNNVDLLVVVMAETSRAPELWYAGSGASGCTLPKGPGTTNTMTVGCAVVSENPTESDSVVWGRWAHEIGHGLQQGGPGHPSNYNSAFDLMDANLPGQTGVFEKQSDMGFPGWMPTNKYQTFTPLCGIGPMPCTGVGGGEASIWAMEYDPAGQPNVQAVRAYITNNLYYLISVRRRVRGDELNQFSNAPGIPGIPDEGVLIERVMIGGDNTYNDCPDPDNPMQKCPRWVAIQGKGGNADRLWQAGDAYSNSMDGIFITVKQKFDADNYLVRITYDNALQSDMMLNPWTSPPGNTWETTDIWVDSPVNGYGTYRNPMWDDGTGNLAPSGNGDDPAIGQINRLYARVRNVGGAPASNIVVRFEITDPPGRGIAGANGFIPLGVVTSAQFPALGTINPGQFVDVYLNWTPNFPLKPADLAAGRFQFHVCVRVKLDPVPGETVLGNQDGDREQENIDYFQATPPTSAPSQYNDVIRLRNDDPSNSKFFRLSYRSNLPDTWRLDVNGGVLGLVLGPGEVREIPIIITPQGPAVVGSVFAVDVSASRTQILVNALDRNDTHPDVKFLGGVRVEARVLAPPKLTCEAERQKERQIYVKGHLEGIHGFVEPDVPLRVMIEGVDNTHRFLTGTLQVLDVAADGTFGGFLAPDDEITRATEVACLFAGTTKLASAGSGYVPIHTPAVTGSITHDTGGSVTSDDDSIHLEFPPHAVDSTHIVTYTHFLTLLHSLPSGSIGLHHFTLEAHTLDGHPTTQFHQPYTLTIGYTDEQLAGHNIDAPSLNVAYWDGDKWVDVLPCAGCGIDTTQKRVTVVLNHFTEFALVGRQQHNSTIFLPVVQR